MAKPHVAQMTIADAIETIRSVGSIEAVGDRIRGHLPRRRPPGVDAALDLLRRHRREALALLRTKAAPQSGRLSASGALWQLDQDPTLVLLPLVGARVETPSGPGVLCGMRPRLARVRLKITGRTITQAFDPAVIFVVA